MALRLLSLIFVRLSMIEICRERSKNVKRWRGGQMALRWCAAGMLEADHQFRRVNGHLHLPNSAPRSMRTSIRMSTPTVMTRP